LALGAFADSVDGQGRKIKEKWIATAMETLALVYDLSESLDRAGSRRDGRAVVASRSKFARGAELGTQVGAQSRGAQTNPPCDASAADECPLSVIRTAFVGPDAFFNSRRNWPT
jgi:hypothetical protein